MMRVGGHGTSGAAGRLWQIAVLTMAGALGNVSHAEAALYYWWDFDPGYYRAEPIAPQHRPKARHPQAKKIAKPEKGSAKPRGPLIIAISIEKQKLKIYDANGFFAETPISTGMKGHPTPMGVFSVIQKHKLHHSNIYSDAPMPYMQRITWSGVAMHAGVLPGYPASHGCIRMPMSFAIKMWNWTRMGVRVVITPGEMTPKEFSHPLLVAQKVVPQSSEPQADVPPAAKSDKASKVETPIEPASSEANLELRSTVGHAIRAKPVIAEAPTSSLREQTHTADAIRGMTATNAPVTMTDAAPSGSDAPPRDKAASSDDKTSETKSSDAATAEFKSAEIKAAATDAADKKPDETPVQSGDGANLETSATGSVKAEANTDYVKENERKPASIKAITDISPSVGAEKDQTRLPGTETPIASKPDPAPQAARKRTGQIAAFISRKDSKLSVRQNLAPLFDAPVTIAPSDRPLGTHVFTAQVDKDDANVLHWSVVSLPVPTRYAERRNDDERTSHRRRIAGTVEMKPMPDGPAEALDRLTIPADAMARITEALSTGGSIIVSDEGIAAGETGEGTDFIVSLH
jgi:lipoprotein-anchoring transpeptidase ErfK/SrfK